MLTNEQLLQARILIVTGAVVVILLLAKLTIWLRHGRKDSK